MITSIQNSRRLILATISLLLVGLVDYLTPVHIVGGIGILYMISIAIIMQESKKTIIYMTSLSTALIIINYIYFSAVSGSSEWVLPINRIISVVGLWVVAAIALTYRKAQHRLSNQRISYTETLEEIIFINSHKVRKPVANIVQLVEFMEGADLTAQHNNELMTYLRRAAKDLEIATREMTDNISNSACHQDILYRPK